ncbi:MAG: hypothetical protein K8Q88_06430 [Nitrosarchaeum sp.]|nr:hypothetical protein [Nitrosarchaeum sp.]
MSVNVKLATTTADSLSSESDIVIGAYVDTRKGLDQISQQFSGQIDGVSLFDSKLDDLQIKSLYDEKSEYYTSQDAEIDLDAILAEIIAEQSNSTTTELNSTEPVEIVVTELIVNATLDPVKETYLISENAELTLEFYDESDVLTNELEELENSLLLLSELEKELEQETIDVTTTEPTNTVEPVILNFIGMLFTIPHADAAEPTTDDQSKIDIANTKEQILLLKEKINAIKNGEMNEQDIKEAKLQLESILKELKQNVNSLSQNNDDVTQKIQNSTDNIEKIGDVEPEDIIQESTWIGNDEQITTEVYDSNGNLADIKYQYEKVRDGKFKLDLIFDSDNATPGLYKVKTTLLVDGQAHVVETEFAWGLVSLNTAKSIYKPEETADFIIVVLNSTGNPVCNSNIMMTVTDPENHQSILTSENGIIPNSECGLYDAQYRTTQTGNYTINITAETQTGVAIFSTYFMVQNQFDYEIIRTAESKIDPVNDPNEFEVNIDVTSFIGQGQLTIQEYVPAVFDIQTDGTVQEIGHKKIITWNKNPENNSTSVSYTYSVPLEYPKLYALGKLEILRDGYPTFTEARNWFVAVDPAVFNDGAGVTGIAACTSPSTIGTTGATGFSAGDNLLIASTQVISSDAGNELDTVDIHDGTTVLVTNEYSLQVGVANQGNNYLLLDKHTASSNPTYNARACRSATASNGEAKIVAISGMSLSDFVDGASTAIGTTDTVLSSISTSLPAGNNIIIASIQIDNGGTAQDLAAGNLKIKSSNGTTITSNQYAISLGTAANTDIQSIVLIGYDSSSASPMYNVTGAITNAANGEAKILVFQSSEAYFVDSGSTAIAASQTTIGTLNTSFASGTSVVVVATTAVDDSDTGTESLAATTGLVLQEAGVTRAANQYQLNGYAISGAAGDGFRHSQVWASTTSSGSPQFTVKATGNATGLTGEAQIIAFKVQNPTFTRSLTESLPLTDTLSATAAKSSSLTESLSLDATATTTNSKSISLTESLPLSDTLTKSISTSLTESLPLTATATTAATTSVSLTESLPLTDTLSATAAKSSSLTESLSLSDNTVGIISGKSVSLTESLPLTAAATTNAALTSSLTESLPLTATATITGAVSVSLTESLPLTDRLNQNIIHIQTDYLSLTDNIAISIIPGNTTLPTKLYPGSTTTEITLAQNNTSIMMTNSSIIETITIPDSVDSQLVINYTSSLVGTNVTIANGFDVIFNTTNTNSASISVNATISDGTILTGPTGWNGILNLPTTTSVTISQTTSGTTTTTYSQVAAIELGVNGSTIQLSSPARLEFTGSGVDNAVAFYVGTSGVTTFITTQCTSDSASGMPASADECYFDNGDDLIIWTEHFTKFGTSRTSTSSSSTSSSGSTGGIGTGSGKTGVGPSGTSRGLGGFGGILGTPLTINEITYDRCEENIATILVSSDADNAPSVTVHTARSGSVLAKLANIQPYEQSNKITKLDKYLYEIPITSDETFLMVVVTEEKGVSKNTVQSAIHLTSCEGTTVISKVPEEKYEDIASSAPKIFDVKFQIENSTQHRSETESEFFYVDNQDLTISAVVDAQMPLQRSELRIITIGQSQEYVAIKMDVESLPISNSTYVISATIPSYLMQEPAISYWIHIIDENLNEAESKQYNIGVKPIYVGDVSFEMDIASIKESGSLVRPQLFVDNKDLPSYGIVSLIVNGEVISKKSQLFVTGETIVNLEWKSPNVDKHTIYDVIASVDLYDKSISTQSAKLHIYPKTITMLASEIKSLESITENDIVLADPAVIYASNYVDQNLRFHVIAPNGQCIIGVSEDCAIHESTTNQRGGLTSIEYEDQIIRVRYSGPDSPLERFSITSIDPLVDNWIVSLETSDGIVPQAQAMKDMSIKVKYRTHSETITVSSE